MKSLTAHRKLTASFTLVNLLAIAPLWLTLATASMSTHAQTSNPSPADWTEFHRDNMQRWNPYETLLGINNAGTLGVKWSSAFGAFSPAVANGLVYSGAFDGNIYALNASTGARLWSYTTGGFVASSPAVANGVVYAGSADGNMYALNASTGAKLWSSTISDPVTAAAGESSVVVANGVVYVTSFDGDLYALNASTGAKLWSFARTDPFLRSSPAVANGVVYISSADGNLYALNATTGANLWSDTIGSNQSSSPAVANGVVYVGSADDNMYAFNASTGAKLWSYTTGSSVYSSPAVANGIVYFGSADGKVYALNASTGSKLWSFTTGDDVESSPAVANGVVYVGSADSKIYALNATTGLRLWSYTTPVSVFTSPVVVNGVVYVSGGLSGGGGSLAFGPGSTDLFLRINPSSTTVHQGDLLTYAFPVWNLGPNNAVLEVLNTQVPAGTTFDYIRISGTPGLGTCTTPPYQGTGQIVCHENSSMAPNTTWTVRLTVKVTARSGSFVTENAATIADTPDPNLANNMATVSTTVQ